jgi:demethylmenaquinone methyltransferase / 2-methoxy-6-polyprenyl-1,4-benzoquinol methylase
MTEETGTLAPDAVRSMFDRIAPVYDLMNRVMTAGLDQAWRRLAVGAVVTRGDRVLDACCGTGDLAVAAERAGGVVTGLDFSPRMLDAARRKSTTVSWVEGDMLALPFDDDAFDAVTVGFGVRNVANLDGGLCELRRVLRPGGRLAILEITRPRGLLRPFFRLWFDVLVPAAGRILPGGSAYTYLPASVRRFPSAEGLAQAMCAAGFEDVRFRLLGGTIVALHVGVAAAPEPLVEPPVGRRGRRAASRGGPA